MNVRYILYSFTNMYTTGIHAGIQTAHAIVDMQRKYTLRQDDQMALAKLLTFNDWADNHRDIRIFNGGNCERLEEIYRSLLQYCAELDLPIGKFYESGLSGALTSVVLVVPMDVEPYHERLSLPLAKLHTVLGKYAVRYAN